MKLKSLIHQFQITRKYDTLFIKADQNVSSSRTLPFNVSNEFLEDIIQIETQLSKYKKNQITKEQEFALQQKYLNQLQQLEISQATLIIVNQYNLKLQSLRKSIKNNQTTNINEWQTKFKKKKAKFEQQINEVVLKQRQNYTSNLHRKLQYYIAEIKQPGLSQLWKEIASELQNNQLIEGIIQTPTNNVEAMRIINQALNKASGNSEKLQQLSVSLARFCKYPPLFEQYKQSSLNNIGIEDSVLSHIVTTTNNTPKRKMQSFSILENATIAKQLLKQWWELFKNDDNNNENDSSDTNPSGNQNNNAMISIKQFFPRMPKTIKASRETCHYVLTLINQLDKPIFNTTADKTKILNLLNQKIQGKKENEIVKFEQKDFERYKPQDKILIFLLCCATRQKLVLDLAKLGALAENKHFVKLLSLLNELFKAQTTDARAKNNPLWHSNSIINMIGGMFNRKTFTIQFVISASIRIGSLTFAAYKLYTTQVTGVLGQLGWVGIGLGLAITLLQMVSPIKNAIQNKTKERGIAKEITKGKEIESYNESYNKSLTLDSTLLTKKNNKDTIESQNVELKLNQSLNETQTSIIPSETIESKNLELTLDQLTPESFQNQETKQLLTKIEKTLQQKALQESQLKNSQSNQKNTSQILKSQSPRKSLLKQQIQSQNTKFNTKPQNQKQSQGQKGDGKTSTQSKSQSIYSTQYQNSYLQSSQSTSLETVAQVQSQQQLQQSQQFQNQEEQKNNSDNQDIKKK